MTSNDESVSRELVLIKGSTEPFDVELVDENGNLEDLASADKATFAMKAAVSDSAAVLSRDTDTGDLSIVGSDSLLRGTLSGDDAAALVPGTYIGQANVRFGSDDDWRLTDYLHVRILPDIAGRI